MDKSFLLQRISIFAGIELDPANDRAVQQLLRDKFNIALPQRRTLDESLKSVASDHELVGLILNYRSL
ncbi:hypothetical protein [uncultured Neptuniibacter sp.]|uniref:hypothetical protein n=1 Tax=uncultured Neptuniibacter sp. TaxID=502143 RepID=UPI00263300D2|nr:hypothetical protein [uncultured Neptuniibacter sp.]